MSANPGHLNLAELFTRAALPKLSPFAPLRPRANRLGQMTSLFSNNVSADAPTGPHIPNMVSWQNIGRTFENSRLQQTVKAQISELWIN